MSAIQQILFFIFIIFTCENKEIRNRVKWKAKSGIGISYEIWIKYRIFQFDQSRHSIQNAVFEFIVT